MNINEDGFFIFENENLNNIENYYIENIMKEKYEELAVNMTEWSENREFIIIGHCDATHNIKKN